MPGRFLLDTSVLIAVLRSDPSVAERLEEADEVYTSVVALGELYFGARRSGRPEENQARVDALAADVTILGCDRGTADAYARIKDRLLVKGRPIPDNDLWIAATAAQQGLTLASRDQHFQEIEDVTQVSW